MAVVVVSSEARVVAAPPPLSERSEVSGWDGGCPEAEPSQYYCDNDEDTSTTAVNVNNDNDDDVAEGEGVNGSGGGGNIDYIIDGGGGGNDDDIATFSLSFSKFWKILVDFAAELREVTYDLAGCIGKTSIFGIDTTINR